MPDEDPTELVSKRISKRGLGASPSPADSFREHATFSGAKLAGGFLQIVVQLPTQRCPDAHSDSIEDIQITLPEPPFFEGDNVEENYGYKSDHTATTDALKNLSDILRGVILETQSAYSSGNKPTHGLRKSAHEHSQQENRVAEEQTWFAAEDVAEFAVQRLAGGRCEKVSGKLFVGSFILTRDSDNNRDTYAVHNP